jgi:dolichol-phosphate mannosyltransferase
MGGGREPAPDYPAVTMDSSPATVPEGISAARIRAGLRKRKNWEQLVRFCVVGASGYVVNLFVFKTLVLGQLSVEPLPYELDLGFQVHYIPAAICSFLVAVTNNYTWNRIWTFRDQRGHVAYQGVRFLVVSVLALAANLVVLQLLVHFGVDKILAQAIAIVLVTPVNFVGNKLWSFGPRR